MSTWLGKRAKTQMINIRIDRSDSTDSTVIRKIIKECYEQLYANNFTNSLKDINEIFPEGKDNLSSPMSITEIESVVKKPSRKKYLQAQMIWLGKSTE